MKSCALTDVGRKRQLNEDFVYACNKPVGKLPNLYMVADGMGGHNAGDVASRTAVESVIKSVTESSEVKLPRIISEAVSNANRTIWDMAKSDPGMSGMGTTLVLCTFFEDSLYVANVGDSRLYICNDHLEQITVDHSLVEEMVRSGQITRQQSRTHSKKNVITRAVGVGADVRPDLFDVGMISGDTILLCSDGLSNMVTDQEMESLIRAAASLEEAADSLVETANRHGGDDNISAVLVRCDEMGCE